MIDTIKYIYTFYLKSRIDGAGTLIIVDEVVKVWNAIGAVSGFFFDEHRFIHFFTLAPMV